MKLEQHPTLLMQQKGEKKMQRSFGVSMVLHAVMLASAEASALLLKGGDPPVAQDRCAEEVAFRIAYEVIFSRSDEMLRAYEDCLHGKDADAPLDELIAKLNNIASAEAEMHALRMKQAQNSGHHVPLRATAGAEQFEIRMQRKWGTSQGDMMPDHVTQLHAELARMRPSNTREMFDTVRSAKYDVMREKDVHQVVESYMKSLLSKDDLSLLVPWEHDDRSMQRDRIQKFYDKIKKGRFVWPIFENELCGRLRGDEIESTGMAFRGRVLRDDDGKILAWLTYKQRVLKSDGYSLEKQEQFNERRLETVKSYLERGVTGNIQLKNRELYHRHLGHCVLFEDIRGSYPLAAQRLGALAYAEMMLKDPMARYVFAYKMYNLFIDPPLDLMPRVEDMGHMVPHNDKSTKLFQSWGFRHEGHDFNPKEDAPRSLRSNVGGKDRSLNPSWEVIVGQLDEVVKFSHNEWKSVQLSHGDLSEDHPSISAY